MPNYFRHNWKHINIYENKLQVLQPRGHVHQEYATAPAVLVPSVTLHVVVVWWVLPWREIFVFSKCIICQVRGKLFTVKIVIHHLRNKKQSGASHISQSLVGLLLGTKWRPAWWRVPSNSATSDWDLTFPRLLLIYKGANWDWGVLLSVKGTRSVVLPHWSSTRRVSKS